jgi:type IV pilus assembly protein PilW
MNRQRGFSLIDLMVGLFVGLLVSLAVYGTSSVVGAQRRSSVGGNGALEAGLAGLTAIQHDIKSAGVGVWVNGATICPTINIYNGSTIANGAALAPVVITAGANAQTSDSITVAFSDSVLANNGIALTAGMPTATSAMRVTNARGIAANDLLIVGTPGATTPCTLMQATATAAAAGGFGWDIAHTTTTWNPASPSTAFATAPAYPAGSMIYDIGQFNWLTYRVRNGNLETLNLVTNAVDIVAENVVMMKAYYGTNNGLTPQIEQWVAATDAWAAPLDAAHVAAIRAVRIAVVSRSPSPEKPSTAGGSCDATTTAPTSWTGGPAIDLSSNTNWQCYRYKTLTLVAPLKNVIFGAGTS